METDAALIALARSGDRNALATLYGRYLPTVWRYVYSRLRGDEPACRDVVSETFLGAIENLGAMDASSSGVAAWLTGIARHKLLDHWRKAGRLPPADREPPGGTPDPATALEAAETRRTVGQVMDRLDPLERVALEWKYMDGLSVREIAGRLARTEKAAEDILRRARLAFRSEFQRLTRVSEHRVGG